MNGGLLDSRKNMCVEDLCQRNIIIGDVIMTFVIVILFRTSNFT